MLSRPLLLLSNDDGYSSPWLLAFRDALCKWADVVVVAPETEQSATSHALSLHRPLRVRQVDSRVFAVDGTPADCVYLALYAKSQYLPRRPDLVCSGINRGLNLGQDAFYSGTIAAAREGALRGIPSFATSADVRADRNVSARLSSETAQRFLEMHERNQDKGRSNEVPRLISLNIPKDFSGELRLTRLGTRFYADMIDARSDPHGREYVWLGGPHVHHEADPGSDTDAHDEGAATLTPLLLDLTGSLDNRLDGLLRPKP
jgi:5'-nucleotidase